MTARVEHLGRRAAPYRDPFADLDFTAADATKPWLPPELLSLAKLPEYSALNENDRVRLSRVDFARLCAAGVWLEGLLMSRVTARGFVGVPPAEARVMLQEVREEAGHSLMFVEMIERAGLSGIALLGPTRLLTWIAGRLRPEYAEFWAMVYIGESVTNNFVARALRASASGERICPLARQVMALHHREEGRHIAAARALLEARLGRMGALRRHAFGVLFRWLLERFLAATLYPTAASLAAAGIGRPRRVARAARRCDARQRLARACADPAIAFMARAGLVSKPAAALRGGE